MSRPVPSGLSRSVLSCLCRPVLSVPACPVLSRPGTGTSRPLAPGSAREPGLQTARSTMTVSSHTEAVFDPTADTYGHRDRSPSTTCRHDEGLRMTAATDYTGGAGRGGGGGGVGGGSSTINSDDHVRWQQQGSVQFDPGKRRSNW